MIQPFTLEDGSTIYVEVQDAELPQIVAPQADLPSDLPPGAEPTGIFDNTIIGVKLLKETISGTAKSVLNSFKDLQPDEWSVEMNISFKSEASTVIPVLSGEGEGSLKVTATWKKNS
ncbi:MAG: CU044_2847 family protein [Thiolinea sp.]